MLFVVDAMIGQDAVNTAQAFQDGVGFTGVVLTKLDGDARGGAALSVRYVTGQPIMFASTGEKLDDFDVFHPDRMASRILGMGDMLTLIEQAQRTFDEDEAEQMAGKLATGNQFTLEDFLEQMQAIRRMGPISNLLGMMPGMGQMKEADQPRRRPRPGPDRGDHPRHDAGRAGEPEDHQRLAPACGSPAAPGVAVTEVNQLVDRFFEARKMMQQMGGGMGLPGSAPQEDQAEGEERQEGAAGGRRRRRMRGGMPALPPGGRSTSCRPA